MDSNLKLDVEILDMNIEGAGGTEEVEWIRTNSKLPMGYRFISFSAWNVEIVALKRGGVHSSQVYGRLAARTRHGNFPVIEYVS